jgi:hypothetical protein
VNSAPRCCLLYTYDFQLVGRMTSSGNVALDTEQRILNCSFRTGSGYVNLPGRRTPVNVTYRLIGPLPYILNYHLESIYITGKCWLVGW